MLDIHEALAMSPEEFLQTLHLRSLYMGYAQLCKLNSPQVRLQSATTQYPTRTAATAAKASSLHVTGASSSSLVSAPICCSGGGSPGEQHAVGKDTTPCM